MKRNRLVIYPQDIQFITGRSARYAQRTLSIIRKRLGKEKHQFVTYAEFCEFTGLSAEDLEGYLK